MNKLVNKIIDKIYTNQKIMKGYIIMLLCLISFKLNAQVGIGTTNPDASSMLDIVSNNSGLLVPRMSTTDRITIVNPANGLLVFDSTTTTFWYYDLLNSNWIELKSGGIKSLIDNDGDTKVDVEEIK